MGLFDSLFGVVTDVAKTVVAPVEIAADITRSVTKPIADLATETKDSIKETVNLDKKP